MYRKRVPKRRGLALVEPQIGVSTGEAANQNSSEILDRLREDSTNVAEITGCKYHPHICGKEAACRNFENNTSKCVCPHDASPPTLDLRCPNRSIVPLTPRPIHNIIPPNGNVTNSTTLPEAEQVERTRQKVPEIIGLTIAVIAVLGILVGILYCYRKKCYNAKSQRNTLDATPLNLEKSILLANKYTLNPQYFTCTTEVPILRRDCLVFLHDIGEGCFGKVYKGEHRQGETVEIVAIKVLKDSASREAEEDFMREVDIMSTFKHENILSLKGVVLRDSGNSPWMVFEYMPFGDLAEVLRSNCKQFGTSIPGLQPFTKDSLHWITVQIAAGMNYLAAQRFVHRDLACRNCLVGSGLVVKIADFGMSRDVYTCDYYKIGGSRLLPVRWMSPESITFGRFTLESDVWSFGVVLWEVYSCGKQPYYGHNNEEVVKLILQGIMLIPPDECPPYICKIMQDCWKTEPRDRISFMDILERLEKVQEKSSSSSSSSSSLPSSSSSSSPTSCLKAINGSLPRPPQGPVAIRSPDLLDPDGYLLPAPMIPPDYLQALPPLNLSNFEL